MQLLNLGRKGKNCVLMVLYGLGDGYKAVILVFLQIKGTHLEETVFRARKTTRRPLFVIAEEAISKMTRDLRGH